MGSSILKPRFALFASLFLGFTKAQTAYESIFTLDAFALQQTCAQACFTLGLPDINCYTDVLGSLLGCPNSPCGTTFAAVDDCYCRGDLQTAAHDMLSACIDQLCSVGDNSVNLATAASIYSGYCTARGFMALPAQNTAETSSPGGAAASTTASTRSGPTSASSTGSSNASSSSSTSTSNTLTIGLASVSAVAVIAILVAAVSCWKIRQRKVLAKAGPYDLGSLSTSLHQLQRPVASGFSDGATDVSPDDSISQFNQPTTMGPSYPNYYEQSAVSTNIRGHGASTVGPGGYFPRHQVRMR